MKMLILIFALITFTSIYSCQTKKKVEANIRTDNSCQDLHFHVTKIYKSDHIIVSYNDTILFNKTFTDYDFSNRFPITKNFCIRYTEIGKIRLKISNDEAFAIDTTIIIHKAKFNYYLLVGYPAARGIKSISELPKKGFDFKKFPRVVVVNPDTIYEDKNLLKQ